MKLLIVAPYFYPHIGGLENYAWTMALGLKKTYKHKIIVVTSNHSENKTCKEKIKGINIYRLSPLFKLSNTPINPMWFFTVRKIIKAERPDCIIVHSPVPFISDVAFFMKGKVPYIMTYHAGSMKKGKLLIDIILGFYEDYILRYIFTQADHIIAYSPDFIRQRLSSFKTKTSLITPGVNRDIFYPKKVLKKKTLQILYVGKIDSTATWKGVDILLDAFKLVHLKCPDSHLRLVGSGNYINHYKDIVNNLGLNNFVHFTGSLQGEKLADEYRKSDVFVLPSLSEAESFGMVLIEAMACGTPVIGSKIGGIPFVIDQNKNGLLVKPGDKKSLAKAIDIILSNKKKASAFTQNGLEKVVKHYDWRSRIEETESIIERVVIK